jgi:hypothetical protein
MHCTEADNCSSSPAVLSSGSAAVSVSRYAFLKERTNSRVLKGKFVEITQHAAEIVK